MCKRITQMPTNSLRTTRETKCVCMWVKASDNQKREREKSHGKRRITSSKKERERERIKANRLCNNWIVHSIDNINIVTFQEIHNSWLNRDKSNSHTHKHTEAKREKSGTYESKKIDFCSMLVSLKVYEKSINQSHRNLSNAFESYKNRLFMNFQPLYLMDLSFLSTSSIFALFFSLSLSLSIFARSVLGVCVCLSQLCV